ncbi:SET domain-containing protein [Gaopeijia maritima]|uniref:SET domain-containing protein n=1 Tax=Gaopeijia maritima TaxID=3119007 RepID=UPI0032745C07
MFRVPTYVAPSPIAGVGVYTSLPIAAGTVIWDFTEGVDLRLDPAVVAAIPEPLGSKIRSYCYEESDGHLVLCGDNARFMNHSFEPNCDDRGHVTRALRDIAEGEELTCDYRNFDAESERSGLMEWRTAV